MSNVRNLAGSCIKNPRQSAQILVFLSASFLIVVDSAGYIVLSWQSVALFIVLFIVAILDDLEKIDLGEFGSLQMTDDIDNAEETIKSLDESIADSHAADKNEENASVNTIDQPAENGADESPNSALAYTDEDSGDNNSNEANVAPPERAATPLISDEIGGRTHEIAARLYDILRESPRFALIQLRLELEEAKKEKVNEKKSQYPQNVQKNIGVKTVDSEFSEAYDEVNSLCHKAVHSPEEISRDEAARVIDLGLRVLDHIKYQ